MASPGLSLLRGFARGLARAPPPEVCRSRFPSAWTSAHGGGWGAPGVPRWPVACTAFTGPARPDSPHRPETRLYGRLTASRTMGRRPNFSRSGVGAAGHDVPGPRLSCSPPVMIQEGRTAQCRTRLQDHGSTVGGHGVPRSKPGLRFALRSARQSVRRMGGWIAAIMDVPPVERPVAHDHQGWGEGRAGAGWVAGRLLPLLGG